MNKKDLINQLLLEKNYNGDLNDYIRTILPKIANKNDLTSLITILKNQDKLSTQVIGQLLNESTRISQMVKRAKPLI